MYNLEYGDLVYFSLNDKEDTKLFNSSGLIINVSENKYAILHCKYGYAIYNVAKDRVVSIKDRDLVVQGIKDYYNNEINKLQSQIKPVSRSAYQQELTSKYNDLKEQIKNTAKNMTEAIDDTDFEDRLKAICQKKKQLFEIECEGMNNARKCNGEIKYKIKKLNEQMESDLKWLDEPIDRIKRLMK